MLADVPCSGEGRIKMVRGEEWHRDVSDDVHPKLLAIQKKIILRGFDLLKKDGVMLYSTCTYNPEENEDALQHLLDERDAELIPMDIEFPHEPGLLEWKEKRYDRELQKAARFYPHQTNSTGFFMAKIRSRG